MTPRSSSTTRCALLPQTSSCSAATRAEGPGAAGGSPAPAKKNSRACADRATERSALGAEERTACGRGAGGRRGGGRNQFKYLPRLLFNRWSSVVRPPLSLGATTERRAPATMDPPRPRTRATCSGSCHGADPADQRPRPRRAGWREGKGRSPPRSSLSMSSACRCCGRCGVDEGLAGASSGSGRSSPPHRRLRAPVQVAATAAAWVKFTGGGMLILWPFGTRRAGPAAISRAGARCAARDAHLAPVVRGRRRPGGRRRRRRRRRRQRWRSNAGGAAAAAAAASSRQREEREAQKKLDRSRTPRVGGRQPHPNQAGSS